MASKLSKSQQATISKYDATQGAPLWGFEKLKADALTQLFQDLEEVEQRGLDDPECDKVKSTLRALIEHLKLTATAKELEAIEQLYHQWNEHKGTGTGARASRRDTLEQLRVARRAIAQKSRARRGTIANQVDLPSINSSFSALEQLTETFPGIFRNLRKAIRRFRRVPLRPPLRPGSNGI